MDAHLVLTIAFVLSGLAVSLVAWNSLVLDRKLKRSRKDMYKKDLSRDFIPGKPLFDRVVDDILEDYPETYDCRAAVVSALRIGYIQGAIQHGSKSDLEIKAGK